MISIIISVGMTTVALRQNLQHHALPVQHLIQLCCYYTVYGKESDSEVYYD